MAAVEQVDGVDGGGARVESTVQILVAARGDTGADIAELPLHGGVPQPCHHPVAFSAAHHAVGHVLGGSPVVLGIDVGRTLCRQRQVRYRQALCASGGEMGFAVDGCIRDFLVIIENPESGVEGELVATCYGVTPCKADPHLAGVARGAEEGDGHTVGVGEVRGAHIALRDGDSDVGGGLALRDADVVVDESRTEDVEIEESREVDAAVEAQRVAQPVGIEVAEGAAVHQLANGGVEQRIAQVSAQRMPHHPALVVGGGAVGVVVRHAVQGTVDDIGDMRCAEHRLEVALVVVVRPFASAGCFHAHLTGEGGAALVDPHVALGGAGHQVAEPGMPQLMDDGGACELFGRCRRGKGLACQRDVVHMLHRAFLGGDVAYAAPAVGTETALEHRHHGVEVGEGVAHLGLGGVEIAVGGGVVAIERMDSVLHALPICLAHGDEVGRRGL